MEINIDSKRNNPLLNRTEVHFTIIHEGEKTPNRDLVRTELADKLNSKKENIIVNYINPGFGKSETTGYAKVYSSKDKIENQERKYILKRNTSGGSKKQKPKEEKKEQKPESESKEEKPEDKKEESEPEKKKEPEEKAKQNEPEDSKEKKVASEDKPEKEKEKKEGNEDSSKKDQPVDKPEEKSDDKKAQDSNKDDKKE